MKMTKEKHTVSRRHPQTPDEQAVYLFLYRKYVRDHQDSKMFNLWWREVGHKNYNAYLEIKEEDDVRRAR